MRSYGRRTSKHITETQRELLNQSIDRHQILLPTKSPLNMAGLFGKNYDDYALEIGFGDGGHLLSQATQNPEIGFIGAEPYLHGVVKLLSEIEKQQIANIKIFTDDVRLLFHALPKEVFAKIFILHPDPWPKKRHHKRRLLQDGFLDRLSPFIKQNALLTIGTDCSDYMRHILSLMLNRSEFSWNDTHPTQWQTADEQTRYGKKASSKGAMSWYFHFTRDAIKP